MSEEHADIDPLVTAIGDGFAALVDAPVRGAPQRPRHPVRRPARGARRAPAPRGDRGAAPGAAGDDPRGVPGGREGDREVVPGPRHAVHRRLGAGGVARGGPRRRCSPLPARLTGSCTRWCVAASSGPRRARSATATAASGTESGPVATPRTCSAHAIARSASTTRERQVTDCMSWGAALEPQPVPFGREPAQVRRHPPPRREVLRTLARLGRLIALAEHREGDREVAVDRARHDRDARDGHPAGQRAQPLDAAPGERLVPDEAGDTAPARRPRR